jgi:hypothetical protein
MQFINFAWGSVPRLYLRSKRDNPRPRTTAVILAATVSGEPTKSAPFGPASASNCARLCGGQPRSRPMRSIIAA